MRRPEGDVMRFKRRLAAAVIAAVAVAVVAVSPASSANETFNDQRARALCASQGGDVFGPDSIWGVDVAWYEGYAGYWCSFTNDFVGAPVTVFTILASPRTTAVRAQCEAAGGRFYVFQRQTGPDPTVDVANALWGCMFLLV
jgi:hypothetical protein